MCNNNEIPQSVQSNHQSNPEHSKSEQEKFEEEWRFYISQLDSATDTPVEDGELPW